MYTLYSSSIDGLRHGAKLEIKKKVVHIESARRQIMHIVLLKRLVTIMVSSTSAQPTPQIKLSTLEFFDKTKHPEIL